MRAEALTAIRSLYLPDRIARLDKDFLSFEEDMADLKDLELVIQAANNKLNLGNPHNSCILFATGCTDIFDFEKARADTTEGSPPDIDIDFESMGRDRAVEIVTNKWGRDNVANIITHGTFKPKSLTRRFFKITEPKDEEAQKRHHVRMGEILDKVPPALFGKEATLEEIIDGKYDLQEDGTTRETWPPHPELRSDPKYKDWLEFTGHLEGMVANFGIHAAGIVISSFPIYQQIPMWKNSKSERITQFDMKEVEELGLIKFDFLAINNLDIIKECVRLVNENHGKLYNPWQIQDGDPKAYQLMNRGLLAGIFQMETSGSAKDLIIRIQPDNIEELSDISALNRPGPLEANFHEQYIANKRAGCAPEDMPGPIADILANTYWTLVYQEQVMRFVADLAGFTLKESDDVRRAMGKKKMDVLEKVELKFIEGCTARGMDELVAKHWWHNLLGFANYGFNKSHSVAYSVITYLCAYFKANYPLEFFCALMTIRSQTMQPKLWAQKAPEYIMEAKEMGIEIHSPDVQSSDTGFTIENGEIFFGLNAIKGIGGTAAASIIKARKQGRFKDIMDFLARVDKRKVNLGTFKSLAKSGAFDRMGYLRKDLLELGEELYNYSPALSDYAQRLLDIEVRAEENRQKDARREQIDAKIAEAKEAIKAARKKNVSSPQWATEWIDRDARLKRARDLSKGDIPLENILTNEQLTEYEESVWLRKKPELQPLAKPEEPSLTRHRRVVISVSELMEQAEMIGCYLGQHPARVVFSSTQPIASILESDYSEVAGVVLTVKEITTRRGDPMAFIQFGDGTALAEGVIFPSTYQKLKLNGTFPTENKIVSVRGRVEAVDPVTKILIDEVTIYQGEIK